MPLSPNSRRIRAVLIAVVLAASLAVALRMIPTGGATGDDEDQALPSAARVTKVGGQTRLSVTAQDIRASGIELAQLNTISYQPRLSALASIVVPQTLAELARSYQMSAADATKADLAAKAARLEVKRMAPLHKADRLISDKAFEAAQNTAATEEANRSAANAQLQAQRAALEGQWGPAIAIWVAERGTPLQRLVRGQELLAQIALPPGAVLTDEAIAEIQPPVGPPVAARIVSIAPQTDPKFQGPTLLATLPADRRLQPGMTLPATLTRGAPQSGVTVPEEAVVEWEGRSWAYVQTADGSFERHQVSTNVATPGGWLQSEGFPSKGQIVVRGAQLLLSEELKAQPGAARGE